MEPSGLTNFFCFHVLWKQKNSLEFDALEFDEIFLLTNKNQFFPVSFLRPIDPELEILSVQKPLIYIYSRIDKISVDPVDPVFSYVFFKVCYV